MVMFFYVSFIDHYRDWREKNRFRGHLEFHAHGGKRCLEACAETQLLAIYGFVCLDFFVFWVIFYGFDTMVNHQ